MKCYVINLSSEKKRLIHIKKQLDDMWIEFERFEAINYNELSESELEKLYDVDYVINKYGRKFTKWELWCLSSHIEIYNRMVREWINECLILEDDIVFNKELFIKLYNNISSKMYREYTMVDYDIFDYKFRKKYIWGAKNKSILFFLKLILMFMYIPFEFIQQSIWKILWPTIMPVIRPLHLCWAYFIRIQWAKKMIELNKTIRHPIDYLQNQAYYKKYLKLYFVVPKIVVQEEKFWSFTH